MVDWAVRDFDLRHSVDAQINFGAFLYGKVNIASLFYTYHIHDSSHFDNEEGLGLFGFKIVF